MDGNNEFTPAQAGAQPTPLTANAVHNAPLLRAIAAGPHASLTALADAAGVLKGNINRKLDVLTADGLIAPAGEASHQVALTDAGRAALAALDRAAPTSLTHDQIEPDPENARVHSGLAGEAFEGLVASIREKGILARIVVRAGPDGRHVLTKGERRWRAWGRLIADGDWPADHLEPVEIAAGDDEAVAEDALIDNLQRADLDNLEKAEAYLRLHRRFGRTPQEIARRIGTTDRHVQELLRVAEKATDEAKDLYWVQAMEGVPNAWTTLRESVKTAKHLVELERNARLRLLIVELACRSAAEHGAWDAAVVVSRPPPGGVLSTAVDLDLAKVEFDIGLQRARLRDLAREWLAGQLKGADDPTPLLDPTRRAALGDMGALALEDGRWGIDFLNPPPPAPEPQAEPASDPTLSGPDTAADPGPAAEAAPSPTPGEGGAAEAGGRGDPAPAAEPLAPDPDPITPAQAGALAPKKALALIEIAHKTAAHGAETRGGQIRGAPAADFHRHALAMELLHDGLVAFNQDAAGRDYLAVLSPKAMEWLAAEGYGEGVDLGDLDAAIQAALTEGERAAFDNAETDHPREGGGAATRYATPWLNVAPRKKAGPVPPKPPQAAKGDPIIDGFRTTFAELHAAADEALIILSRIDNGDGAGDDEIGRAIDKLKAALAHAQPYLRKGEG